LFGIPLEIITAVIALLGGVAGTRFSDRFRARDEKAAKVDELLGLYRDPLLGAAYELQSRLYNIARQDFLSTYLLRGDPDDSRYADNSTLWIIGQYFGWTEILRREVQFLDLGSVAENRRLQGRLDDIGRAFGSDRKTFGGLRVFTANQRAIGEVMIREPAGEAVTDRTHCLGYTEFSRRREDDEFWKWFKPLARDLKDIAQDPAANERIIAIQRAAVELVDVLDPHRIRYPNPRRRGRLAPREAAAHPRDDYWVGAHEFEGEVSRVVALRQFDAWALIYDLPHDEEEGDRTIRKPVGLLGSQLVVQAWCDDRSLQLEAHIDPPRWTRRLRLASSIRPLKLRGRRWRSWWARRRGRALVDELLGLYQQQRTR